MGPEQTKRVSLLPHYLIVHCLTIMRFGGSGAPVTNGAQCLRRRVYEYGGSCWTTERVGVEVVGEDVPRTQEARLSLSTPRVMAQGVVFIHSTPVALCPHIAWT